MTLDELRQHAEQYGWVVATHDRDELIVAHCTDTRTSIIHAQAHADDLTARIVDRQRLPMRTENTGILRRRQPNALRGRLSGPDTIAWIERRHGR